MFDAISSARGRVERVRLEVRHGGLSPERLDLFMSGILRDLDEAEAANGDPQSAARAAAYRGLSTIAPPRRRPKLTVIDGDRP